MKGITPMQLPLSLKSIFNSSFFGFLIMLFPIFSFSQENDVTFKAGISFYNKVDDSGLRSENLSNNFVFGTQMSLLNSWSISLDGATGGDAYIGTSLDYTTNVSDDFSLFGQVGADVLSNEVVPKLGGGIETEVNNRLRLTMGTVIRKTNRFPDYQFTIAMKYQLGKNSSEFEKTIEKEEIFTKIEASQVKDVNIQNAKNLKPCVGCDLKNNYRVVKGDTFWGIARKFKLNPNDLIDRNKDNIKDPDLIYPGDIVVLYSN